MRTKAFEDMIHSNLGNYQNNLLFGVGQIQSIKKIERKKIKVVTDKKNKKGKYIVRTIEHQNTNFDGVQYDELDRYDVRLHDQIVIMTIGRNGTVLTFHYFGFTPDETSDECLLKDYEQGLMVGVLLRNNFN